MYEEQVDLEKDREKQAGIGNLFAGSGFGSISILEKSTLPRTAVTEIQYTPQDASSPLPFSSLIPLIPHIGSSSKPQTTLQKPKLHKICCKLQNHLKITPSHAVHTNKFPTFIANTNPEPKPYSRHATYTKELLKHPTQHLIYLLILTQSHGHKFLNIIGPKIRTKIPLTTHITIVILNQITHIQLLQLKMVFGYKLHVTQLGIPHPFLHQFKQFQTVHQISNNQTITILQISKRQNRNQKLQFED